MGIVLATQATEIIHAAKDCGKNKVQTDYSLAPDDTGLQRVLSVTRRYYGADFN